MEDREKSGRRIAPAEVSLRLKGWPHAEKLQAASELVEEMSEIFDAESPYTARGCIAQAWTVAEVLRGWLLTEENPGPQ